MGPGKLQRPHLPLDSEEYRKSPGEAEPQDPQDSARGTSSGRSRPLPPGEGEGQGGKEGGAPGRRPGHHLEEGGWHGELIGKVRV